MNDRKKFKEKIDSIENLLKQWKNRYISLFGKIQVIKTFAVSKFVLPATIKYLPKHVVKKDSESFL